VVSRRDDLHRRDLQGPREETFPKGASLEDPSGLFNADLKGGAWRAIDIHEDDKVDAKALKALIRTAVALNAWHKTNRSKTKKARA
jgi:hypothetical protein